MQILVVGNSSNLNELRQKFGSSHTYVHVKDELELRDNLKSADVLFDFVPTKSAISGYAEFEKPVFLNSVFETLDELLDQQDFINRDLIFGFCGLPTFVDRSVFEVSVSSEEGKKRIQQTCFQLGTDFICVSDEVGFVSPRVICMIINEAYYTSEEGTALREDIDLAMKLGTNYPFGPFEWAKRIGTDQVIKLLDRVYDKTNDERYKICALLRDEKN